MTEEQQLVERIKRHSTGPMSEEEIKLFRDVQAFIDFCIENGLSAQTALTNLAHDVNGLLRQERGFLPKVTGYTEIQQKLRAAKDDSPLQADLMREDKWD